MKKVISLLLALTMCFSISASALAIDSSEFSGPIYVLGTPEGQTGILLDDSDLAVPFSINLLFSMSMTAVSKYLTSDEKDSSKYFTRSSLSKGYLQINGIVNSTDSRVEEARVGACYYDADVGAYQYPMYSFEDIPISTYSTIYVSKSDISRDWLSYGYVQNIEEIGTLSGTLYFYNSDEG